MKKTLWMMVLAVALLVLSVMPARLMAADLPQLENLNLTKFEGVIDTFGADVAFRPLEPASSYGRLWGVSLGITGNITSAKELQSVLGQNTIAALPGAELFVGVQAPLGLALELGILPSISVGDFKAQKYGGAIRWTFSDVFLPFVPLDLAVRAMVTKTELSYDQTILGVKDTIKFDSTIIGTNLSVSKRLLIFEPFAGLGYIRQDAKLGHDVASNPLFDPAVTSAASLSKAKGSAWYYGGLQLRLPLITITGQMDSVFGATTYAAKFGFKL